LGFIVLKNGSTLYCMGVFDSQTYKIENENTINTLEDILSKEVRISLIPFPTDRILRSVLSL